MEHCSFSCSTHRYSLGHVPQFACSLTCLLECRELTHCGRDNVVTIFADDIFICIFLNGNFWISNIISLKYVPCGLIDNKPLMVQTTGLSPNMRQAIIWTNDGIVYWRTYICASRPQWVKRYDWWPHPARLLHQTYIVFLAAYNHWYIQHSKMCFIHTPE